MRRIITCLSAILGMLLLTNALANAQTRGLVLIENGTDTLVSIIDGVVSGDIDIVQGDSTGLLEIFWLDNTLSPFQPGGSADSLGYTLTSPADISLQKVTKWKFKLFATGAHGAYAMELRLYLGGALNYTSPMIDTHILHQHIVAEGLRLVVAGDTIVYVNGGTSAGEVSVPPMTTSDTIEVFYIDINGVLFQPDTADGFSLLTVVADTSLATTTHVDAWKFVTNAKVEGMTDLVVGIYHETHSDYESPNIELHVENAHVEAEGLRLVQGSDTVVSVDGATVTGSIHVAAGGNSGGLQVWFLDALGQVFQPDTLDPFTLVDSVANNSVATTSNTGHWSFEVQGVANGSTNVFVRVFHENHYDYTSPPIPIMVTCCVGLTGNVDGSGAVNLADLSALASYLTGGGYVPACPGEADVNANGTINLADLSALVSFLTGGGFVLPSCS